MSSSIKTKPNKAFELSFKYSLLILASFILAFGVQLIVGAKFGPSTIDNMYYNIASLVKLAISSLKLDVFSLMGFASFYAGSIVTLCLYIKKPGKEKLLVWLVIFIQGFCIFLVGNLIGSTLKPIDAKGYRVLFLFLGIFLLAVGISLSYFTKLPVGPFEEWTLKFKSRKVNLMVARIFVELICLSISFGVGFFKLAIIDKFDYHEVLGQFSYATLPIMLLLSLMIYLFDKIGKKKGALIMKYKNANTIDHTKLGLRTNRGDLEKLVNEAKEYGFYSICIPPALVKEAKDLLEGTDVKITTVISFPHGNDTTKAKVFATKDAISNGADEIDMVMNVGYFKDRKYSLVLQDIKQVKKACKKHILKVIIETSSLTPEEIQKAALICVEAGADFVKTSTGFDTRGASFEDVKLIKQAVGDKALIKASGGVKTFQDLEEYLNLGASRIGSSKGVELVKDNKEE